MDYSSIIESEEALFSRGAIQADHLDGLVHTPTKAHNSDRLDDSSISISESTRGVVEVWQEIDSAKLSEFDKWALDDDVEIDKPDFIVRLEEKIGPRLDSELLFTFFNYTDSIEIPRQDMRTYIELCKMYSDVITAPIQTTLIKSIVGSLSEDDLPDDRTLPDNVYRAYKDGLVKFCEESKDEEKSRMGVIPIFSKYWRMSDHIQIYEEDYDIKQLCIDYRNCTPTKEEYLEPFKKFVGNFGTRDVMESRLLYALNPRSYSSQPNSDNFTPEDFLLGAMGFDIIGESHLGWGGSSGDEITSVRLFNREKTLYRNREISSLWRDFPHSGLSADDFEDKDNDPMQLRGIFNSEQLEFAFQDLRDAIFDGTAFEFLRAKEGLTKRDLQAVRSVATAYAGGTEKAVYEYSN